MHSELHIHNLELYLNLGWRNKERAQEQAVLLDIDFYFPAPPKACNTDNLEDTICYAKLIEEIRTTISAKHYRLIEHVSADIYQLVKQQLPENVILSLRITKFPRISGLKQGVSFVYGDKR